MKNSYQWFLGAYFAIFLWASWYYFSGSHGDTVLLINENRNAFFDSTMPYITHLGDGWFFAPLIIILAFIDKKLALVFGLMGVFQAILSYFTKRILFPGTPRPKTYFEDLDVTLQFIENVKVHGYNSFPSGHTMTAFAIAAFFVGFYKNRNLSILFLLLACIAGYSRIYLLQHFLIDIIVGSIIGVLMGFASFRVYFYSFGHKS